jgi:hypothetical protein
MPIFPPPSHYGWDVAYFCAVQPEYASLRDLDDLKYALREMEAVFANSAQLLVFEEVRDAESGAVEHFGRADQLRTPRRLGPSGRIERSVIVTEYGFVLLRAAAPQS